MKNKYLKFDLRLLPQFLQAAIDNNMYLLFGLQTLFTWNLLKISHHKRFLLSNFISSESESVTLIERFFLKRRLMLLTATFDVMNHTEMCVNFGDGNPPIQRDCPLNPLCHHIV